MLALVVLNNASKTVWFLRPGASKADACLAQALLVAIKGMGRRQNAGLRSDFVSALSSHGEGTKRRNT